MKKIFLTLFIVYGILNSAYSQSISGTADPCSNENISYTFTPSTNYCTSTATCTDSNNTVFADSRSFQWSLSDPSAGVIGSSTSLTTNIKWNCPTFSGLLLKMQPICSTFTEKTMSSGNKYCVLSAVSQGETQKSIQVKCPTPLIISGPNHITCCDTFLKTYSVGNTFGQKNLVWEVLTTNGWEIISGQGTASINARAGSTGASQQVKVTSGYPGCNFENKAVGTLDVSRTPIIEEDIAPSLPWITAVCIHLYRDFCVKPITTCSTPTTFTWSVTPGNTKGGANPTLVPNSSVTNCLFVDAMQNPGGGNNGFVDITVTATTPCATSTKTHRVLIPEKEPAKPTWTWDGGLGDLCVATRNVVFEITNAEEGSEFEWIFNNGTTSYTMEGYQIGTNFEEFGTTWSANPNSNVTLTIRAKNACGYGTNTTFLISAARFKAINDQDCDMYLQKRSNPKLVNNELLCYPNPANKLVTILKPTNLKRGELKIYDAIGKLVSTQILESDININTENWAEGIYYIYLIGEKQTLSTKIEITK